MSKVVSITEDVTAQPVITTRGDKQGICVIAETAGSLGGGTLTLLARAGNSNMTFEVIATITLGYQDVLWIGGAMDVAITMAGSTDPDVDISISEV